MASPYRADGTPVLPCFDCHSVLGHTATCLRRVTYWLVWGGEIIGSVRLPEGTPDDTVRSEARLNHLRNPTIYADFPAVLPYEQERRIVRAEVRRYADGR